uniref:Uncharacterized protein n=2 Tax=Schistocephalus solidus TaxID=70667 RepID=A0A0V0JBL3_SCHSO
MHLDEETWPSTSNDDSDFSAPLSGATASNVDQRMHNAHQKGRSKARASTGELRKLQRTVHWLKQSNWQLQEQLSGLEQLLTAVRDYLLSNGAKPTSDVLLNQMATRDECANRNLGQEVEGQQVEDEARGCVLKETFDRLDNSHQK